MKTEPTIRRYISADEATLFTLLEREGEEWQCYWGSEGKPKYVKALAGCVTYLVFEDATLCGYARCRHDDGFGIYVYDLLVDKAHRGRGYGHLLMLHAAADFPGEEAYVMSGVDGYYDKLGYKKEGTIYRIG